MKKVAVNNSFSRLCDGYAFGGAIYKCEQGVPEKLAKKVEQAALLAEQREDSASLKHLTSLTDLAVQHGCTLRDVILAEFTWTVPFVASGLSAIFHPVALFPEMLAFFGGYLFTPSLANLFHERRLSKFAGALIQKYSNKNGTSPGDRLQRET